MLIGRHWACFKLREGWQSLNLMEGRRSIAWAETVAIRLGLLTLSKLQKVEGSRFFVWTDNTTSQAAVTKRKSKDEQVNGEWKEIQRLLTLLLCDIDSKRVASKGNVADALSRGFLGDLAWYDEVKITVPADLGCLIKQVFPPAIGPRDNPQK